MNSRMTAVAGLALAVVFVAQAQTQPQPQTQPQQQPQAQEQAQTVEIQRAPLGSGQPGGQGFEAATLVGGDLFHVPQYLPGSPTAASIWPRVVRVRCTQDASVLRCEGYNWIPAMGRAEYLFFIPVIAVTEPAATTK